MKLTLHYKLFAAFLTAILIVVVYMSLVMQWSFDRGFLNYVNTIEQEQLNKIATDLESFYRESGSWSQLSADPRKMLLIIVASFPEGSMKERFLRRIREEKIRSKYIPSGPVPEDLPPHFFPRVFLLDRQKQTVYGFDPGNGRQDLLELTYQNSVVGYLGAHPAKDLSNSHQLVFARQQKLALVLVAVAGFLLAAGLSLPLAYRMTKPLRRLAKATRDLSSGKYDTRIDISGGDEFGQLAQDFNNLAVTLDKNQQARSQWIADISHELRTPLSILRGKIEALEDGVYSPTRETFTALHQEVVYLGTLVDDLYQLSLSDIGAMSYHRVQVRPCWALEEAVALMQPQLDQKKHTLEMDCDIDDHASVFADNERLKQLFTNLLANSVRYTDEGGRITIKVRQEKTAILYDIQDSSPGVDENHLPRLFERLYRVDSSRSRNLGGAGLGLSICSNIVKGHGGAIEAKPSPLGGLWISISLPLSE
ncbi:MAG TPA: ATP-binding protein [Desulfopila sp.]|nr:ATP-binding protein [Desulfopila sp.]